MGRRTHESIGRPLPGRTNLVLSRDELFVIGGADVFAQCLVRADRMYLTEIDADVPGDARFPDYAADEWREVAREPHGKDARNPYPYTFLELRRASAGGA